MPKEATKIVIPQPTRRGSARQAAKRKQKVPIDDEDDVEQQVAKPKTPIVIPQPRMSPPSASSSTSNSGPKLVPSNKCPPLKLPSAVKPIRKSAKTSPIVDGQPQRYDSSLGLLTRKFTDLVQVSLHSFVVWMYGSKHLRTYM